jgi:hypothetical protein
MLFQINVVCQYCICRLCQYFLRRRGCWKKKDQPEEEYFEKYKADPPYKQSNIDDNIDYGSSVFIVERYRNSDSDPVYQDIGEIVTHNSDTGEDAPDNSGETEVIKHEKEHQKPILSNIVDKKPSIMYGVITAKEVAKYRPSTPNIIRR